MMAPSEAAWWRRSDGTAVRSSSGRRRPSCRRSRNPAAIAADEVRGPPPEDLRNPLRVVWRERLQLSIQFPLVEGATPEAHLARRTRPGTAVLTSYEDSSHRSGGVHLWGRRSSMREAG